MMLGNILQDPPPRRLADEAAPGAAPLDAVAGVEAPDIFEEMQAPVAGIVGAETLLEADVVILLRPRHHVDHPGKAFRAVEGGVAALDHLHPLHIGQVDQRDVENVVQGAVHFDAVVEHDDFIGIAAANGDGFPPAQRFIHLDAVVGAQQVAGVDVAVQVKDPRVHHRDGLGQVLGDLELIFDGLALHHRDRNHPLLQIDIAVGEHFFDHQRQGVVRHMLKGDQHCRLRTDHLQFKAAGGIGYVRDPAPGYKY